MDTTLAGSAANGRLYRLPPMSARVRVSAPAALPQTLAAIARTAAQLCEANDAMIFQVDGDSFLVVAKHGRVPTTRRLGQTFPLDRDTVYGAGGGVMAGRILAVDDQEDNRRILRDLLTTAGYEVIEAVTGEDAVTRALAQRPDLILMDIQLPGIDGYEATRRIKANPALRAVPVIAVTSYALSGDETKALAAGADAYVSKPFSPRALLAKVREFLG